MYYTMNATGNYQTIINLFIHGIQKIKIKDYSYSPSMFVYVFLQTLEVILIPDIGQNSGVTHF